MIHLRIADNRQLLVKMLSGTVEADAQQVDKLLAYVQLLLKWNQVYNLTAITEIDEILKLHIVDSACVLEFVNGRNVLDIGSGAGLPGLVLAILAPENKFTLVDSNNKKTRFLRQCKLELGIDNVDVMTSRIEEYKNSKFDTIVCRAFASLDNFVVKSAQHLQSDGILLAMKGKWPEEVLGNFKFDVHRINLPGINVTRHVIRINNKDIP